MTDRHLEKFFEDKMDQIMVAIRASHPNAQDIKDLSAKLDAHVIKHEEDIQVIYGKLDPISSAFQKASGFKATVILISTTMVSIWAIVESWKKLVK